MSRKVKTKRLIFNQDFSPSFKILEKVDARMRADPCRAPAHRGTHRRRHASQDPRRPGDGAGFPRWLSVVFGANLGGNQTPIGSASTLAAAYVLLFLR